ncbi:MAG: GNAT family N-acetyltransferase [Spirochaetia bacterium]|jgi:ribosomal-protein-alanine N-acetyltransferase|nr:GNAT family N-acetyltransferase [Spirochaetia bacterium]
MTVCLPIFFTSSVALSAKERLAVERLIRECKIADAYDPCLEFDTHLNADSFMPAWHLAWAEPAKALLEPLDGGGVHDSRILVAAASTFAPSKQEAEISACVSPVFRRQGIFMALYERQLAALGGLSVGSMQIVCENSSPTGAALASRLGATFDHAEFLMRLPPERLDGIRAPEGLRLVPVSLENLDAFADLSAEVFAERTRDAKTFASTVLADPAREQFMARATQGEIGTVATSRYQDGYMIHGLGVAPNSRSQGLGAAILDAVLVVLRNRGARDISLEVDMNNGSALALYRSRGFVPHGQIDYWRLPEPASKI